MTVGKVLQARALTVMATLAMLFVAWMGFTDHPRDGGEQPSEPRMGGAVVGANPSERARTTLWPEIEPFGSGHLSVSEIHRIYYEVSGNPEGTPVFFVHGGPGGSSYPRMRRRVDPERCLIVLHDQRGAGRSLPDGELRENTTQDLVADIERLRLHLGVGEIVLVGGSWGTTLALVYAEEYPDHVAGMVLRGVFTATEKEIDHIFHGGAAAYFPDAYEQFLAELPKPGTRPLPAYLSGLLREGDPATRRKVALAFARYTTRISVLEVSAAKVEELINDEDPLVPAFFETYYMAHDAFLETDQIMQNVQRIAHIPTVIINGRYDLVCPPKTAFRLHRSMPRSSLIIIESSGHTSSDPEVEAAVIDAIATVITESQRAAVP